MKTAPATKNDYLVKKKKIEEEGVGSKYYKWKTLGETDSSGDPQGKALVYDPETRTIAEGEWNEDNDMKKGILLYEDGTRYEGGPYWRMCLRDGKYKVTTPDGHQAHVVYNGEIPDNLAPFVRVEDQLKLCKVVFLNKAVYEGSYKYGR